MLTDERIDELLTEADGLAPKSGSLFKSLARLIEAEVRAEAQEPVAWFTDDNLHDKSATTYDPNVAARWKLKGWPVAALYATPQPPEPRQGECGEYQQSYLEARSALTEQNKQLIALQAKVTELEKVAEAYENQVELHNLTLDKVMQQEQYINELLSFIEEALTVYPTLNSDIETYKENNTNALQSLQCTDE